MKKEHDLASKSYKIISPKLISKKRKRKRMTPQFSEAKLYQILVVHRKMGNKWNDIAEKININSENEVKNIFYSYQRKVFRLVQKPLNSHEILRQIERNCLQMMIKYIIASGQRPNQGKNTYVHKLFQKYKLSLLDFKNYEKNLQSTIFFKSTEQAQERSEVGTLDLNINNKNSNEEHLSCEEENDRIKYKACFGCSRIERSLESKELALPPISKYIFNSILKEKSQKKNGNLTRLLGYKKNKK